MSHQSIGGRSGETESRHHPSHQRVFVACGDLPAHLRQLLVADRPEFRQIEQVQGFRMLDRVDAEEVLDVDADDAFPLPVQAEHRILTGRDADAGDAPSVEMNQERVAVAVEGDDDVGGIDIFRHQRQVHLIDGSSKCSNSEKLTI